jgi:DNA polymerase (family 10)
MTNREVAWILNAMADMLELKNDNPYRVRAYRKAAHTVYHLDEDLRDVYLRNAVGEIPGIGSRMRDQIEEMLETGSCIFFEQLRQEVPQGLLDMLSIPGLGHKTIRNIYQGLGIDSIEGLAQAAQAGKIRRLPGMGAKTESNILAGIHLLKQSREKITLGLAAPVAEDFSLHLKGAAGVIAAEPVGSIRRGKPLVGDIDILVAAEDFKQVRVQVASYSQVQDVKRVGQDFIQGLLHPNMKFEVIIVKPEDYYHSLTWTTGSKEFRELVFQDRDRKHLKGLKSEEEVFRQLGLQYIPPEMRENKGEIPKAISNSLPVIVEFSDILGELHVHTDWSDGAHSLQDMAVMAQKMGYAFLAITDHSQSLNISGGLSPQRLMDQGQAIDELNRHFRGFTLLKGSEVDILKDGTLDYHDEILKQLDLVIASIHSHFKLEAGQQTARIIKAIENPHVHIIGHLTGRLLNRRPPYELDTDQILAAAAEHHKVLEINAHPDRLDIDESIARKAAQMGIKIAINSDAHHGKDLKFLKYGVMTARRGWLKQEDVINTWDLGRIMDYFHR